MNMRKCGKTKTEIRPYRIFIFGSLLYWRMGSFKLVNSRYCILAQNIVCDRLLEFPVYYGIVGEHCICVYTTHGAGSRVWAAFTTQLFWPTLPLWWISRAVTGKSRPMLIQFQPCCELKQLKSSLRTPWSVMLALGAWLQVSPMVGWGTFDLGWQRRGKVVSSLRPQWSLCCISQPWSYVSGMDTSLILQPALLRMQFWYHWRRCL